MGYGVVSLVRGALAKRRKDDDVTEQDPTEQGPTGPGPDGNAAGIFPNLGTAPGSAFDALDHEDTILTDCDGCDHSHDRTARSHRHNVRKHAVV